MFQAAPILLKTGCPRAIASPVQECEIYIFIYVYE